MLFNKLAKIIIGHQKAIIALWLIVLLCVTPLAIKTFTEDGVLQYDMTTMVGDDTESIKGLNIIGDENYFQTNTAMDTLIVIECKSESRQETIVGSFFDDLETALSDKYGEHVILANGGYYTKETVDENSDDKDKDGYPGIVMFAVSFDDDRTVKDEIPTIRGIIKDVNTEGDYALTTYVSGSSAISYDTEKASMEDVKKIDPFSILLVLILIGLFFRSFISAATPPITIGFAYVIVLAFIFGLSQVMDVFYITSTIVMISMLGAGCDYCIFIISRYREERRSGKDKDAALEEAVTWAGESIATSGCSVIIGFGVMSFCSFSMISTMGIVLAAGIVFALLAALTLIPSIISLIGDKIFYPSTSATFEADSKVMTGWYGKVSKWGHGYFVKSAHFSIKHAGAIIVAMIIVTVPLTYVYATSQTSYDTIAIMPAGESNDGVSAISEYADAGMIMPTYVLLDAGTEIATLTSDAIELTEDTKLGVLIWKNESIYNNYTNSIDTLSDRIIDGTRDADGKDMISSVSGIISWEYLVDRYGEEGALEEISETASKYVKQLTDVSDTAWFLLTEGKYTKANAIDYVLNYTMGSMSVYKDGHQYVKLTVTMTEEPMSDRSIAAASQVKEIAASFVTENTLFVESWTTGTVLAMCDISGIVNSEFVWIELAVVLLIFILLFVVMRSYLTPVRALLSILMSIAWTMGLTFIVFDWILGIPVSWVVPVVLFVLCLGLGMDYDILLTTRIKENVRKGMSNDDAIVHAVENSGSVITICGLIMGGAFLTMVLSSSPMLMEFGFALGFAILVDALIVRTYIVPAVMHVMGKWNWVGPKFMQHKDIEADKEAGE